MTTRDTPEAALDAAMAAVGVHVDLRREETRPLGCGSCMPATPATLAAMTDMMLVPRVATADWTGSPRKDADVKVRWHHSPDAPPEHFCEDCDRAVAEIARL